MDTRQETVDRLAPKPKVPWYRREFDVTARATACAFLPLGIAGMWWNWHDLHTTGMYSPEVAGLSPFLIVLAFFYFMFPDENPRALPKTRLRAVVVFTIGGLAAAANWAATHFGLY
jgi:hypothetical protein